MTPQKRENTRGARGARKASRPTGTRARHARPTRGRPAAARGAKKGRVSRSRPPRQQRLKPSDYSPNTTDANASTIPPLAPDTIRIIPLGGVEEIGRNMTLIEYNDDIIVVDCGFMFQEKDTPGVDYILPNTQYLEERKEKIRGLIITHGHLDHIGGIPYIIDRIGNPPVYTRRLTSVMVKKRQEEFPHLPNIDIREVEQNETIALGKLSVRFFGVTHTIPDSMGAIIKTPHGGVAITGDIKLNHTDGEVADAEKKEFALFKDEKILCLLMDSTNTGRPGWSIPEHIVFETFERIIKEAKHRLIIGTFASQLERVMKIIEIAEKNGKKVAIEGRSMKSNLEIAKQLKLLKTKPSTLISSEEMSDYPESKIVVLATGAQGDEYAALMRAADKTHKFLKYTPKDTVVLSSSVIPGNERAVQSLKDKIARQGTHIVTYETSDVHASGHGNREEARWIHQQIQPRYFIPQHGYHYMLRVHADLMRESCGLREEDIIVPDNGTIVEIHDGGERLVRLKERAPMATRIVEGLHVKNLQAAVMSDRQALAQDGIFVIVIAVNFRAGKLRKSPDIASRGFIYLRESQELLGQTRLIIKKTAEESLRASRKRDTDALKKDVSDAVSKFLLQQTHKRPIVMTVVVGT